MSAFLGKKEFYKGRSDCKAIVFATWEMQQRPDSLIIKEICAVATIVHANL